MSAYVSAKDLGLPVPTLRATLHDGRHAGATVWVAAVYFRGIHEVLPPGEQQMPLCGLIRIDGHVPRPGETLYVHNPEGNKVYATTDMFASGQAEVPESGRPDGREANAGRRADRLR